ncbi:Mediator of RNA polymerase II transcription subunit 4 [Cichlidogyrus casuarinus]|uniref:Mediator of RNA polymerase II transcription subunit 4 n=1 Tax=Cichlidogyrus casuarinus TaxID=1844966 RepID=A0ABD2QKH6_9PLAT
MVSEQLERQNKVLLLKKKCLEADKVIESCQNDLRKCECVLSTALYYSRQKIDSMTKSIKNPVNPEELIKFSHKISACNGAVAPTNWTESEAIRPYPSKGVIRSGFLGHLDDSGNFRQSVLDILNKNYSTPSSDRLISEPGDSSM